MKKILIGILLTVLVSSSALCMGLSVDDLVRDYNKKYGATWFNCSEVSKDFYRALDQNFQLANLDFMSVKTGSPNPITNLDGHAIVTYTIGSQRYVITTYSDDNIHFKVVKKWVGAKSLHQVAVSLIPDYKYVGLYRKGFGFIYKSRKQLMMEGGHRTTQKDDVWDRVGKKELEDVQQQTVWSI